MEAGEPSQPGDPEPALPKRPRRSRRSRRARAKRQTAGDIALAEILARLRALTPRVVVTPALLAANLLVFGAMAATGVGVLEPDGQGLIRWGANYGPATTRGEPWRLLTSMFVHIGIVHLLMNMWVLFDVGRLMERLLGPVAFSVAYLVAGLVGSLTSLAVHPQVVSAGASGAIFGLYGALGAFLLQRKSDLPIEGLKRLGRSSLFFVGYNVLYGIGKAGIDMAAHLGGMAGGFAAAWLLVHELTTEARARIWRRAALVAGVGLAVVATAVVLMPRTVTFASQLSEINAEEKRYVQRYRAIAADLEAEKVSPAETALALEKEILPVVRARAAALAAMKTTTDRERELVRLFESARKLHERMYMLVADACRAEDFSRLDEQLAPFLQEQEQVLAKIKQLAEAKP